MLTPLDDYPIHQTSLPLAHTVSNDPNHYDRFWCNGYSEDWYFAAGMAVYPNRGIIDAAFAVVHGGVQRSVFASGRMPIDRRETRVGPLAIEIVEPLRVMRVRAEARDLGIDADVVFTNRTVALVGESGSGKSVSAMSIDVVQSSSSSASALAALTPSASITRFIDVTMRTAWGNRANSTGVCL